LPAEPHEETASISPRSPEGGIRLDELSARDRILAAAETCFGQGGFARTSLREVAEVAGVSKALIHYHFDSKEGLLLEMQSQLHRRVADEVRRVALEDRPGLDTAMRAFEALARAMVRFAPLHPVFLELGALAVQNPTLGERTAAFYAEAEAMILAGIRDTLGPLADRLEVPAERLAKLMMSCLYGIALSGLNAGTEEIARLMGDFKLMLKRLLAVGEDLTDHE
jgi:AcrR family transcriptional regulator